MDVVVMVRQLSLRGLTCRGLPFPLLAFRYSWSLPWNSSREVLQFHFRVEGDRETGRGRGG